MHDVLSSTGESGFKNLWIVNHIRQQIVEGQLAPGAKLAPRHELEQFYGMSRDTVQRALDRLAQDGFVYTNGRRGTYVSLNPPHLSQYALVFRGQPNGPEHWTQFEETLYCAARDRVPTPGQRLEIYHGVENLVERDDYRRLERDVQEHRLAGLIFTFDPEPLRTTPLMTAEHVARVAIVGEPLAIPTVNFGMFSFVDRALDFVVARGRSRVAVVSHLQSGDKDNRHMADGIITRGLVQRRYWFQTANVRTAESADECVHLLMHPGQAERPDALIIDNDNLVFPAIRGLIAAGVKVPEEVEVVTHANFPPRLAAELPLPVTRLGFDMRRILDACFESMEAQRRHETPSSTTVGAVFQSELNP